jgi:protein-L-isoaspartate(D-aspartate) O-methyltransferase
MGSRVDPFFSERQIMVAQQLHGRGIRDERILAAMERVPRHLFVAPQYYAQAYGDHPIPIAAGQTISQPYIVAAMLEALQLRPQDRVLDIGTGSGYQTALLAELTAQVFSIERHPVLAEQAKAVLDELKYANTYLRIGDGTQGWPEAAPFDAVVVAAAGPQIPRSLVEQLAEGGRMIIPVGSPVQQDLQLLRNIGGQVHATRLDPCRFVPLIGAEGFQQ